MLKTILATSLLILAVTAKAAGVPSAAHTHVASTAPKSVDVTWTLLDGTHQVTGGTITNVVNSMLPAPTPVVVQATTTTSYASKESMDHGAVRIVPKEATTGVSWKFTPLCLPDGRLQLSVSGGVKEIASMNETIENGVATDNPSFTTYSTDSTVVTDANGNAVVHLARQPQSKQVGEGHLYRIEIKTRLH